jgi:hypothetical protein
MQVTTCEAVHRASPATTDSKEIWGAHKDMLLTSIGTALSLLIGQNQARAMRQTKKRQSIDWRFF